MGACIKPSEAPVENLHLQFAVLKEAVVDGGYLKLAARRRLYRLRHLDNLVGIEVESYDGIVRLWFLRLLLDADSPTLRIELNNAIALGVVDAIAENCCMSVFLSSPYSLLQQFSESTPMKDIVAKNKRGAVVADEILANDEGLRKAVGAWLLSV